MCRRFESYRRSHLAPKPKGEAPARHAGESGFESRRRRQYSGTSVHGGTLRSGRSRRGSIPWSQTLSADKVLPAARPASNRKARVRPSLSAPNCRRGGMHTHSAQNAASSRTWGFESLRRHPFRPSGATGRRARLKNEDLRVRLPPRPPTPGSSSGKTPLLQRGAEGSIPSPGTI